MAISTQAQNVKLGPCDVSYGGTDLGLTKGGVEVALTTSKHEVKVDQFGDAVVNHYIMGRTGMVKVPMAESDLAKLVLVIPGSILVTDAITPTKKKLVIPSAVGTSLLDDAQELVLHPTNMPPSDHSEDVIVPLASPAGDLTFAFNVDNERVYNIEFQIYPDADGLMMIMGDQTATA